MSVGGQERPLGLFEVLARNRQSALGLSCRTSSTPEQPLRMFTILPRQQLSLTTRLVLRRRNFTHLVINTHTHAKERHTERKKYTIYACKKKRHTHPNICFRNFPRKTKQSRPYSYHTQHRDAFESEKAKKSKSRERSISVFQEASI